MQCANFTVRKIMHSAEPTAVTVNTTLPRLVDFGAGKCLACQKMEPVLNELRKEYVGSLQVDFIDVWKDPDEGRRYGIRLIPTQIFYDGTGRERFRHEGFFAREDILKKWRELGISIEANSPSRTTTCSEQCEPVRREKIKNKGVDKHD